MMTDKTAPFSGRVAIVTGGGGNIGLATALRLAADGAAIALVDMDAGKLAGARKEITDKGGKAGTYCLDITDADDVGKTVDQIVSDFGGVDFLFNNAGYQGAFTPVPDYPEDDFQKVMMINVCGAFSVLQAVARHMVKRGFGRIVNTASMAGVEGPPNMAAYGTSKFAVVGMTQVAAKDLAPHNIRVNAISPGLIGPGYMWDRQVELQAKAGSQYFSDDPEKVAEEMIAGVPMRRYGSLEEIAGVVAFLLGDDSNYMTGVNLPISGGII